MDGQVIAGLVLTVFGALLTLSAVLGWRYRREERINLIEAVILKTTGAEPLPHTRFDRIAQWFHTAFAAILGPLIMLTGLAILAEEFGLLT